MQRFDRRRSHTACWMHAIWESKQIRRSSLLSGRNVRWPRCMLTPGELRWVCAARSVKVRKQKLSKCWDRRPVWITVNSEGTVSWATFGLVYEGRWAGIFRRRSWFWSAKRRDRQTKERTDAIPLHYAFL